MHRALSPAYIGERNILPAPGAGLRGLRLGKAAEITKERAGEQTTVLQVFKSISTARAAKEG